MKDKSIFPEEVPKEYVEFQVAVLRALPRDIDSEVALSWTKDEETLARILRKALMPEKEMPAPNVYPLLVNYEMTIEEGIKAANQYRLACPDLTKKLTTKHFPPYREGTAEVMMELIHFNWRMSTEEVLHELDRMGYRPAEFRELLAFAAKYPEAQGEFDIVALGAVWEKVSTVGTFKKGPGIFKWSPVLHGKMRTLDLVEIEEDQWVPTTRFAAIRKWLKS